MARKYHCMYCNQLFERPKLIQHIDKKHREMIPQDYTAARLVFDKINNTTGGKCRVCGAPTKWNEESGHYDVLCDNPKCKEELRNRYKQNMIRVRGTYNILNDPEQQKLMLAHRKISGEYHHSDGGVVQYTGEYERKLLEFMDVFMRIPSKDIISPGPTMLYMYKGKKHIYIPDFIYLPYNLIIEIKDGGDNPNNKQSQSMIESREKTIEKERLITDQGQYNYIRLTNNQFVQLVEVFMEIKEKLLNEDESKTVKVNEAEIHIPDTVNKYFISKGYYSAFQFIVEMNQDFYDTKKYADISPNDIITYKTLTPKQFEKLGYGVCFDYVCSEDSWFRNKIPNIRYETWYTILRDDNNNVETHTYLIFEYETKWYWFESAWQEYAGIRGFNSKSECVKYIEYLFARRYIDTNPAVFACSYDASDKHLQNVTLNQFNDYLCNRMTHKNKVKWQDGKSIKYIFKQEPNK